MSTVVTLRAEWEVGPFWVSQGGGVSDPYDVDEISEIVLIEESLLRDVDQWDSDFQALYRPDDPASSGFAGEADRQNFVARGRLLAQRLRQSLDSSVEVRYSGDGTIGIEYFEAEGITTYYAKIDEGHPRNDPRGIVRRRVVGSTSYDEAFTRNLQWEPTEYLQRYRLGHDDIDHVKITKAEADAFIERMSKKLSGDQ